MGTCGKSHYIPRAAGRTGRSESSILRIRRPFMSAQPMIPDDLEETRYRAVFDASPDGIVITDADGTIRDVNPMAEELFGYDRSELLGEPVEMLVPRDSRGAHRRHREAYADDPSPRPMGIGMELRGRRADGSEVPVEISLSPLVEDGERFVVATIRDVTDRLRLRRFGTGTLQAAEEERQKLARELHDDTAQRLAAVLLRIQLALRGDESSRRRTLEELREEILETAEGVRRIARGLRPPALDEVGLRAAVRGHIRDLARATAISVRFRDDARDVSLDRVLDQEEALVLYRVLQEAVSNAVRHSGGTEVVVRLDVIDGVDLVMEVTDDGRGFALEEIGLDDAGLGLIGMRERTSMVNGRFSLQSRPGEGTRVRVELPLSVEGATHG